MKDNEFKEILTKDFEKKLKEQLGKNRNLNSRGENFAIHEVIKIQAFLQTNLEIVELVSGERINFSFYGFIDYSIKIEDGIIEKMHNQFSPISVTGKYIGNTWEFDFDEIITLNITN